MQINFHRTVRFNEDEVSVIPIISIPNPRRKVQSVYQEKLYLYDNLEIKEDQDVLEELQKFKSNGKGEIGVNLKFSQNNPLQFVSLISKAQLDINELRGINVFLKSINAVDEWSHGRYKEAQNDIYYTSNKKLNDINLSHFSILKKIPHTIPVESFKVDLTFLYLNQEVVYKISDLIKLGIEGRQIKSFALSIYQPIPQENDEESTESQASQQQIFDYIFKNMSNFHDNLKDLEDLELIFSSWTELKEAKSLYAFVESIAKYGKLKRLKIILGLNEQGFKLNEYSAESLKKIVNQNKNLECLHLHIGNSWIQEYNEHLNDYATLFKDNFLANCPNLNQFSLDITQKGSYERSLSLIYSLEQFLKGRDFEYLNLNFAGWQLNSDTMDMRELATQQLTKTLTAPRSARHYYICISLLNLGNYYDQFWIGIFLMNSNSYFKKFSLRMFNNNKKNRQYIDGLGKLNITTEQTIYQIKSITDTYRPFYRKDILSHMMRLCLKQDPTLISNSQKERFRYYDS